MHFAHISRIWMELTSLIAPLEKWAEESTTCRRKGVGCSIVHVGENSGIIEPIVRSHNGPSGDFECSNEVGNCGCSHAEPRAIVELLKRGWSVPPPKGKLIMLCNYSPCTNCANFIIDYGLIGGLIYDHPTMHDLPGVARLSTEMFVLPITANDEAVTASIEEWCKNA